MRKYTKVPSITGKQLIKLFEKDEWQNGGKATHGISLTKKIKNITLITIIPDKSEDLPEGTLGAILGVKQSRLGKKGLLNLINLHGLD